MSQGATGEDLTTDTWLKRDLVDIVRAKRKLEEDYNVMNAQRFLKNETYKIYSPVSGVNIRLCLPPQWSIRVELSTRCTQRIFL